LLSLRKNLSLSIGDLRKGRKRARRSDATYPACVLVRPATLDDVDALAAGMAEVAEEGMFLATEAPIDVADAALRIHTATVSEAHSLWVLDDARPAVGCAGLHPTSAAGVASLGMWIVAAARGRGGGRALLATALDHARDADLHKVELEVWPGNARAIALYAGAGFAIEGVRRDHYRRRDGALHSILIMALAV
jgi:RimJ/RimL family protein N-acetyltransferase